MYRLAWKAFSGIFNPKSETTTVFVPPVLENVFWGEDQEEAPGFVLNLIFCPVEGRGCWKTRSVSEVGGSSAFSWGLALNVSN